MSDSTLNKVERILPSERIGTHDSRTGKVSDVEREKDEKEKEREEMREGKRCMQRG